MSEKTAREVAFLRDLYIDNDWTTRFTNLLDENLVLPDEGTLLYVEPGTGIHLLGLNEKLDEKVEISAVHTDIELLRIAEAKSQAVKADIAFHRSEDDRLPLSDETFDTIIADASLIPPQELPVFLDELNRVGKKEGNIDFYLPTAGSFGEFFSILWEALYNSGMEELGPHVEELINELPQVTQCEDIAVAAGLTKIETKTKTEFFDYENGAEFMNSFLMTEFLLPRWLGFLSDEQKEKIVPALISTIDDDVTGMTFRLSVKATIVTGKKV